MSKYKVGDKVVVRKDLEVDKYYDELRFAPDMDEWSGKEAIVKCADGYGRYRLEDTLDWVWTDEMFENPVEFPEGCIIYNGKYFRKVLGACGKVKFLSSSLWNYDPSYKEFNNYGSTCTMQDLEEDGYKLYTPKPKLTHKQLEEKLGYEFELEGEQ